MMSKIFVSCGQFTEAEKSVGKEIVQIVKAITGIEAFFAEQVQDLNGLDSNILNALRECAGFITVIHPRGKIIRPDGSTHIRASVWIEQEIAIATYIQRVEKRTLPVIAFIHQSVGREGIRDLLHLNPILFTDENQILAALPGLLEPWKKLATPGIRVELRSTRSKMDRNHRTRNVVVSILNGTNQRITSFNCEVEIPVGMLNHWDVSGFLPEPSKASDPRYLRFRFDETMKPSVSPRSTEDLIVLPCCMTCACEQTGESQLIAAAIVEDYVIRAKLWADGREYEAEKTVHDLIEWAESTNP